MKNTKQNSSEMRPVRWQTSSLISGEMRPTRPTCPTRPTLKSLTLAAAFALLAGCGIRSIELVRNTDGYDFEYTNIGLKTDVTRIEIEKSTNGAVRCVIDGVATDVSAENKRMIEASGTAVGNVAQKVVEGLK